MKAREVYVTNVTNALTVFIHKQTFTALLIALKSRVIVLGKVACRFKSMYIIKGNHWE